MERGLSENTCPPQGGIFGDGVLHSGKQVRGDGMFKKLTTEGAEIHREFILRVSVSSVV